MTLVQGLLLGLVQGLTEFLPVSSTAHLVVVQNFFALNQTPMTLDIIIHLATALATVITFWSVIKTLNVKSLKLIAFALIPTGILGLWFNRWDDLIFGSVLFSAITLIINGLILFLPRFFKPSATHLNSKNSLLIGTAQGLAVLPGISRSGATIVTALLLGIKPQTAYNFSFLISLPAIAAALLLQLKDFTGNGWFSAPLLAAFLAAFLSGLLALKILRNFVSRGRLEIFAVYCLALGFLLLL